MSEQRDALERFQPQHEFFVGIDSDGCAFDTMELKHKECFIPNIIKHYGLQSVSKYVREVAEFVNLYSNQRGINRFPGLVATHDLLAERPEVTRRGVPLRDMEPLRQFVNSATSLGNPALEAAIAATGDENLKLALTWSRAVNDSIADMVHGVKPFPYVRECLQAFGEFADQMCVSATPVEALSAEWREHDIAKHVAVIAGQEVGTKKDTLQRAVACGYAGERMLMIGDSPGDMKAAQANGALFYPVIPGEEESSWERLFNEGLKRFREGTFAGAYETERVEAFLAKLPETPPWKQ